MCVTVLVCLHEYRFCGGQRPKVFLELELWVVMSLLMWVPGAEFGLLQNLLTDRPPLSALSPYNKSQISYALMCMQGQTNIC